jgi:F-type H+-transporting ATPase subunit c
LNLRGGVFVDFSVSGGLVVALGGVGPAIGIGLIGMKAMEAIGRNPDAQSKVMPAMLLGMAFAEAIAIYALVLAFIG